MGNTGAMPDERVREILGFATRAGSRVHAHVCDEDRCKTGVSMRELEQLAQHVIDLRSATNLNEASLAALEQANQALEAELAQCKTLLEQARTELHDIRQASPLPAADNVDAIAAIYGVR